MYYYDPNDKRPFRWAVAVTGAYALLLLIVFRFVTFDLDSIERSADEILVEFIEPEPQREPDPPRPKVAEPRMHDNVSPEQNEQQVTGTQEETRTVNPRALFRANTSGVDEPEDVGNPKAKEGDKNTAHGNGGGLSPDGNDQLDKGLQGRGLVGDLPRPSYPGNRSGKVIVRVTVDASGRVTNAVFEPSGSTSSDSELIKAALDAARKARFTESRSFVEGGTITYYFNLK